MVRLSDGFTLIELLVTTTIVSIVIASAVPSFSDALHNNQLKSSANSMYSLFQFARAEAAQKGETIHIGALDASNWSNGVVVWVDQNSDAIFSSAQDTELRRSVNDYELLLVESSALSHISFNGKGYASSAIDLGFCDSRTNETGKQLRVLTSGVSVVVDKVDC